MTSKQYEHLGRLLEAEAILEMKSEQLDDLRNAAHDNLSFFVGADNSRAWIHKHYGQSLAMFCGCRDFMSGVRDIIAKVNAEEAKKCSSQK